jgi:hypothetical protein
MKRAVLTSVILLAGLLGSSSQAWADHRWNFGFGIGFGGGYFRGSYGNYGSYCYREVPRRFVHVHVRVPVYSCVWVPPVHETVIVGYNACRAPIYRTVVTCNGYYRSVLTGYRCNSCGNACY